MAVSLRNLILFVFCFSYFAVSTAEINHEDFKLKLEDDWVMVTDEVLRKYEADILVFSDGKVETVYLYGFQLKDAISFTSGPYILIKVERLNNTQKFDIKMVDDLEKKVRKVMDVGNGTYDDIRNYYWSYYDDKYNQVEKFQVLLVQKLAVYGKVSIFFHAKKSEFKLYEPRFKKIAYSLSLKKEDDPQLLVKEHLDKLSSKNQTKDIVMLIFGTVVTSLVGYLLKVFFDTKKNSQKVSSTELPTNNKNPTPIEPPKILFENNAKDIVADDRRGVIVNDDEETFINEELEVALLVANHRIGKTGGRISLFAIFFGVGLSVSLYSGLLEELMGLNLSKLHVWGIYIIIPFLTFLLSREIHPSFEKRVYLKERANIQAIANKSGFSKYKLISFIDDYKQLRIISLYLKKDIENKWK